MAEHTKKMKLDDTVTKPIFSQLDKHSQETILNQRNIIFQGNEINLKELLAPLSTVDLDDFIDSDVLSKLQRNEKILVGREVRPLDDALRYCYIPRRLHDLNVLNPKILPEKKFHEKSYDLKYMVTIGGAVGTGKSTFITNLANVIKAEKPNSWVLKIDLANYLKCFSDFKKNDSKSITLLQLLNSSPESALRSDFENKIFSIPDKLIILLDGVNEVPWDCKELLLSLINDCKEQRKCGHFVKKSTNLFILTGSLNLRDELGIWMWNIFDPFSQQEEVEFLSKLWANTFQLTDDQKERCHIFAEAVTQWIERSGKDIGIPMRIRMVAEILESGRKFDDGITNWEGCYEFINSDNVKPVLPKKLTVVELYQLYIHKKCSGNARTKLSKVRSDILEINSKWNSSLQILALQSVLGRNSCDYFSSYKAKTEKDLEEELKSCGIVNNKLFTHRSFAEYFVAESISEELPKNPSEQFLEFFVREILYLHSFNVVRMFFDHFIRTNSNSLSAEVFTYVGHCLKNSDYNHLFYTSAKQGLLGILQFLFKCCQSVDILVDANDIRVKENHALHCAAQEGYLQVVELLLKNGTRVNTRNEGDSTALHLAAGNGSLEMVKFVVGEGIEVNAKDKEGYTPLHKATKKGCLSVVKYLIEQGAKVNSRSQYGVSALHIAAAMGKIDMVEYLVECGAIVNSKGKQRGTVLSNAVSNGNFDVMKYLVGKGADVMTRSRSGGTILYAIPKWGSVDLREIMKITTFFIEKGVDINSVNNKGDTLLHNAIEKGYKVDFIKFLVEQGANIGVSNNYSDTPLTKAISRNDVEMVKYLMESGAEFNTNHNQNGILCDAVRHNRFDVVKYLLERGVNLDIANDEGLTTLEAAVCENNFDMVKLLVRNGVTVNSKALKCALQSLNSDMVKFLAENGTETKVDFGEVSYKGDLPLIEYLLERGCTFTSFENVGGNIDLLKFLFDKGIAVHTVGIFLKAARKGHEGVVKLLLEKGVDINVKDIQDRTALYEAADHNHFHVVKLLLQNGADVDMHNGHNRTALVSASSHGFLEIVKLLIEAGANVNSTLEGSTSPLGVAAQWRHFDVVKVLVQNGANFDVESYFGTPLCIAFTCSNLDIADYLAQKDPSFKCTAVEVVKRSLADLGTEKPSELLEAIFSRLENVRYLVKNGIDIDSREINNHKLIVSAVKENDVELVKYFLERGGDVNITDNYTNSVLHETTDIQIARLLIRNGADVNAKTREDESVLRKAIAKCNLDMCMLLVESGADVNEQDSNGRTLLHMRVYDHYDRAFISLDKIKYLVESGAQLKLTKSCRNVLHEAIASVHKSFDLVAYFLELGADVNCRDENGNTPLTEAVSVRDPDLVELLVEGGAVIDGGILLKAVKDGGHESDLDLVRYLVRKGADVNAKGGDGRTVLHKATAGKLFEIVKFLVQEDADVNAVDKNGCTVLYEASRSKVFSLMEYLVKKGASLDGQTAKGRTLLHEAASSGSFAAVKFLIENGVDVNVSDRDGRTALHEAAGRGRAFLNTNEHLNVTKLLIENGAWPNARTRKGLTPLHEAAASIDLDKVKLLVEKGADINVRDEYGRTPLFSIVMEKKIHFPIRNTPEVIEFLVRSGANLAQQADNGRTVLHEASLLGDVDTVKVLVGLGADVNEKTRGERTALHDAARRGMLSVVQFLVERGVDVRSKTAQGLTALEEAAKGEHEEVVEFLGGCEERVVVEK